MGKKLTDYLKLNLFKGDKGIWMIYFLLCMVSLVSIYSASSNLTFSGGNHWGPVVDQAGFLLVGLVVILLVIRIPCKFFKLLPLVLYPVVILMLVYVLFSNKALNEGARWISVFGVSFQPSEIAKSVLILAVAVVLSRMQKEEVLKSGKRVLRATKGGHAKAFKAILLLSVLVCGLIAPENFSTAAMLALVIFLMMFVGNIPPDLMLKSMAVLVLLGALFVAALLLLPDSALSNKKRLLTWKHRIEVRFKPEEQKKEERASDFDTHRQEMTARIAIANSNVIGLGVGNSIERDFLPHAESDFIFSIIIEEMGIFGALLVILLYMALLVRVCRIAQKCDRFFPAFLVIGLGAMLVLQAFVNMAVAVGWAPVTGQTLPLISRGGTSILVTSLNIGMILSVSRYAEKVSETKEDPAEQLGRHETAEIYSAEGMA